MPDDLDYYNRADLWDPDALPPIERERVETTLAWVPEGIRSVVDVGCGDGRITNRLVDKVDRVVGVDLADTALESVNAPTVMASADRLPFPDASFDLVLCTELLEHLDDAAFARTIREVSRIAVSWVLLSVPNEESLANAQGRCPRCGTTFHVFRHRRGFGAADLKGLLPGFTTARLRELGPRFYPARRLDVGLQHRLLRDYFHSSTAVCPTCGTVGTSVPRHRLPGRLVRGTRRIPPWRRRHQWLLALYRRSAVDLGTGDPAESNQPGGWCGSDRFLRLDRRRARSDLITPR